MRIQLCSLLLNEEEWLLKNYEQHKDWPGLVSWCFVHGADRVYGKTSPALVTADGFSVDNTRELLRQIARQDSRVTVIEHGWMDDKRPDQGKCHGRNRYLRVADEVNPDWLLIADLDEFYTHYHQRAINDLLTSAQGDGYILRQRHIWHPESVKNYPLFGAEVVGGYWSIPHCRIWKWRPGMEYVNDHNWPIVPGTKLISWYKPDAPQTVHMGFASQSQGRRAKHAYYRARGEGRADGRQLSVICRAAWETWTPGTVLPGGANVFAYYGPQPEVFCAS